MDHFKKYIQTLIVVPLTLSTFVVAESTQNLVNPLPNSQVLAQKELSLGNRYDVQFVNDVFKDNILLNLAYLRGTVNKTADIDWKAVTRPFQYEFKLSPNKTFAFHEDVKDQYKGKVEKTTNAHFNGAEGFKTDGYLFGDGVCHLASLLNWVAQDAGLEVEAPTNHDFAKINDISKEYGVSIYSSPFSKGSNAQQNLYITNNKNKPIAFKFEYKDNKVSVAIVEEK